MTLLALLFALLQAPPQAPPARARAAARALPFAHNAMLEVRRLAGAIGDPALRAAVEAQLLTPWLPSEAWVYAHPKEAAQLLNEPALSVPPHGSGDFAAAPGGDCEEGHHGYPGGLAVHTVATALHARALAQVYGHVYGVSLQDDWLVAAAIWHDSLKAATLPFRADGSCGPEPRIAGTQAHHVLGLAAAILRHLPKELIFAIASAHEAPTPGAGYETVCGWVRAAGILAEGKPATCPPKPDIEAFVNRFANADSPLTTTTWSEYVRRAPKGWERLEALRQDGNDVLMFSRSR